VRRIGGTDAPKLVGVSPYGGALEVYNRIVLSMEAAWNPRMERGAAGEPVLRAHGQRMLGLELEERETDYHLHPYCDFAGAQIDDLALWEGCKPVAVDYKTQSVHARGWGKSRSDKVPAHLEVQMRHELACCDRDLGLLVVGFGEDQPDGSFHIANIAPYIIKRDGFSETQLMAIEREFWESHILKKIPPLHKPQERSRSHG
jgi:predicted phage-related endonuclease